MARELVIARYEREIVQGIVRMPSTIARHGQRGSTRTRRASGDRQRRRRTKRSFGRSLSELADGQVVYRIRGQDHFAEIRAGRLVLPDGTEHASPSSAAGAVNGGISVNGWKVWTRNGQSIGDIVDRGRLGT